MQAGVGLLVMDMMPIYMIIALDIVITMRFSINCPIVIYSSTVCYVFEREASSENYGPRVYFIISKKILKIPCCNLFTFLLFCILSIYHYRIWSLQVMSSRGLTTLLLVLGASICYLCAGVVYVVWGGSPTGSITLVSSLREIPTVAILHHPFFFGEIST